MFAGWVAGRAGSWLLACEVESHCKAHVLVLLVRSVRWERDIWLSSVAFGARMCAAKRIASQMYVPFPCIPKKDKVA
jgi:hypothetical protein